MNNDEIKNTNEQNDIQNESQQKKETINIESENLILSTEMGKPYDSNIYKLLELSDNQYLDYMIDLEIKKMRDSNLKVTLPNIEKKKNILMIIYSLIVFILISVYFVFHRKLVWLIFIFLIATIICFCINKKYNFKAHIRKEIKARPNEKISYVIASSLSNKTNNKLRNNFIRLGIILLGFILPLLIFSKPHIIYEKTEGGYAIRYYTLGAFKNEENLVIPSTHKGKNVVGIRGNVFMNVKSLKTVKLPDTILEIRGSAFQGCTNLININLPKNITEVRGSTFEDCTSLTSIEIPEGVIRIGGSAFRNCYNLTNVTIPKTVKEIGSSAFRNTNISFVCVSKSAYINPRAFKGTNARRAHYEDGCTRGIYGY